MFINTWQKKQYEKALEKARDMVTYWKSKDAAFWLTWKGNDKNTIIKSWENLAAAYEHELDRL